MSKRFGYFCASKVTSSCHEMALLIVENWFYGWLVGTPTMAVVLPDMMEDVLPETRFSWDTNHGL